MISKNLINDKPYWLQFLILFLLVAVFASVFSFIGLLFLLPFYNFTEIRELMANFDKNPQALLALKWMQAFSTIGTFLLPALFFAYWKSARPLNYLNLKSKSSLPLYLLASLAVFAALPPIHWFLEINQQLTLPESWKWLENWMLAKEKSAEAITKAFLIMDSPLDLLINLVVIALLPALAEELIFRGVVQQLFREWFGNIHWAIFAAALLFSAIHVQFYGFLPRMLLGMLFGYLFYWSGNLWVPIVAHFINNGMQVLAVYLYKQQFTELDIEAVEGVSITVAIASAVVLSMLLYVFYKKTNTQPLTG